MKIIRYSLILCAYIALTGFSTKSDKIMKNESIVRTFVESWSKHDVDMLISLFSIDCEYEIIPGLRKLTGRQQIAAYAKSTYSGVPDTEIVPILIMADDSIGIVEWIWKGTNSVGWPDVGIKPTGKRFEVRGISVMEIENGQIKRNRDYWDWNTFITGIGETSGD